MTESASRIESLIVDHQRLGPLLPRHKQRELLTLLLEERVSLRSRLNFAVFLLDCGLDEFEGKYHKEAAQ